MLLMPPFDAGIAIVLVDTLLPLWPANPVGLAVRFYAHHLLRRGQIRIDSRCKRMDQFWPRLVPQPEHGGAIAAEVTL